MTFLKSCSAWWPMSSTEFSKPFVKPASAINRAGLFPGLLYHKNDHSLHLFFSVGFRVLGASLVAQRLKRLPAMQETWVRSLGREDPLEKEMATYSSILAWRIPWTEEPGGLQFMGSQELDMT